MGQVMTQAAKLDRIRISYKSWLPQKKKNLENKRVDYLCSCWFEKTISRKITQKFSSTNVELMRPVLVVAMLIIFQNSKACVLYNYSEHLHVLSSD